MTSQIPVDQLLGLSENHIQWISDGVGLHCSVVSSWQKLCDAAAREGIELAVASSFRSFDRQCHIWNRKCSGELAVKDINNDVVNIDELAPIDAIKSILTFSALPGASRHHWGTDIDFYSPSLLKPAQSLQLEPWEYQQGGPFASSTNWLTRHAHEYGFYFPYDKYRGGIACEPWHLSYFPLANAFEKQLSDCDFSQEIEDKNIIFKETILDNIDDIMTQFTFNIGHQQ